MAARAIIARAHSLPLEARQAPPQPPMPPAASMVFLRAPLAGEGADLPGGDAALDLGPLGRLGHVVAPAEHVVRPLVEAVRALGDVLLVVGPLGEPRVRDRQGERHVGPRSRREPLVAEQAGGVVVVGVDEHHLDAEFLEPEAARGALEGAVHSSGRLGVGRPEDHHLGVLERVLEEVVLLRDAEAVAEAPHVGAAPLPALPAVRVVLGIGEADEVHEAVVGAEAVAHVAPEMVGAGGRHHRRRPVLALDAQHLGGDHVERLVPADGFVGGLAAILDVALAVRVEVDALERRHDAVRRVDGGAVADRPGRERRLARRGERTAARRDGPGRRVGLVELQRDDALDAPVLDVHVHRPAGGQIGESPDSLLRGVHPRITVQTFVGVPGLYPNGRSVARNTESISRTDIGPVRGPARGGRGGRAAGRETAGRYDLP